jgi:hypothetical protein
MGRRVLVKVMENISYNEMRKLMDELEKIEGFDFNIDAFADSGILYNYKKDG